MSNYDYSFQVKESKIIKNLNLSEEATQILEILNELEDFTISMRKQLMKELRLHDSSARLNLEGFHH